MVGALSPDTVMAFLVSLALVADRVRVAHPDADGAESRHPAREAPALPRAAAALTWPLARCALPIGQLVALRFASDAELPGLVNEVLSGHLTSGKDIKQSVKDWQGDFLRA